MSGVVIREWRWLVVEVGRILVREGKFELVDVSFSDAGGFECGEVEC